jgi:hypothetical protein
MEHSMMETGKVVKEVALEHSVFQRRKEGTRNNILEGGKMIKDM